MSLATVTTYEAIGAGASEVEVDFIDIILFDDHTTVIESPIVVHSGGAPEFSMERWVRFKFDGSFGVVNTVKVWAPGFSFPIGWKLRAGSTDTYQTPRSDRSLVATQEMPTTQEEAVLCSSGNIAPGGYSDWLVLQAVADGQASEGLMVAGGITLRLYWLEGANPPA